MTGLIEHYEEQLGPIEGGWTRDKTGAKLPFQVARFDRGPNPGTVTFATLGLHRIGLTARTTRRHIHHELLMTVPTSLRDGPIPGVIQQVALETQSAKAPILRGDVIGPRGPIVSGSEMEALYATAPSCFPDAFATCREGSIEIAIVWLVPISHSEVHLIGERGWRQFETLLLEQQPDLVDIYRKPIQI